MSLYEKDTKIALGFEKLDVEIELDPWVLIGGGALVPP